MLLNKNVTSFAAVSSSLKIDAYQNRFILVIYLNVTFPPLFRCSSIKMLLILYFQVLQYHFNVRKAVLSLLRYYFYLFSITQKARNKTVFIVFFQPLRKIFSISPFFLR